MSLRYHEISEANHRILNPFSFDKLMLLGEIAQLSPGVRQLDLCSGKGEMLCQWSAKWGHSGTGVDISKVFLAAARERATEMGVADRVSFVEGDASAYVGEPHGFDIVSCIGATWIGGGLEGTLKLMTPPLRDGGLLLVGEPYWAEGTPQEAFISAGVPADMFTTLSGTYERLDGAGFELVEMVLSSPDDWDRYVAGQWRTVDDWLRANPGDPEADAMRAWIRHGKEDHLRYQRKYLGWGVFVLRRR